MTTDHTDATPDAGGLTEEERDALRLTDEEQAAAHEAMQEGEWQWFGWLYLRKFERILASPALSKDVYEIASKSLAPV